jgi:hypothetical protein
MTFDFTPHLTTLYPSTTYTTTPLSGGLVNFTVRAHRTSPPPSTSTSISPQPETPTSLILKHAPPYIATVGAQAPFSPSRQTTEATCLRLLTTPGGPLAHLGHASNVRIPRVLWHNTDASVLALEDLGERMVTLWEVFDPAAIRTSGVSSNRAELVLGRAAGEIGRRLGAFFAGVHAPETLAVILGPGREREREVLLE